MTREESEHPLDKHIRDTLSPMQPAYKAESWDALSRRLEGKLLDEDALFDQAVRNQLGRVSTVHRRRGWHRLVLQLELEYRRTRAVISCKSLEFIAALLLLLLISPGQDAVRRPSPTAARISAPSVSPAVGTVQGQSSPTHTGVTIAAARSRSTVALRASDESREKISTLTDPVRELTMAVTGPAIAVDPLLSVGIASMATTTDRRQTLLAMLLKPAAITPRMDTALPNPLSATAMVTDQAVQAQVKKTYLRMGPVGGPDYLRVITPPTTVGFDTLISLDRYAAGYHGGFSLGIEHGRWELETGLIYAVRRYTPIPVLYISGNLRTGFFAAGLHNFEFNTVNIPLNGRINVLMRNQWRIYALSGVSLNMVLEANYYTAGEAAFSTSFLRPPSGNNGRNEPGLPGSLEDKLTKGWLEGGRFLDNTTLYGNIGGGVERYMSPVWSLFSQTVYQHSLYDLHGGIGPYKDRVHALSVMLGVKVRL